MNYEKSIIPANDNIAILTNDIRETLGLSVSRENFRYGRLSVSPKVNKWSRYKPVNGGFSARGKTGFTKDFQFEQDLLKTYQPPTGGEKNLYCIRHFVGYKHSTQEPVVTMVDNGEVWIAPNGERRITIKYRASGLDFKADGYNELIVQQEMHGGGKKVIGIFSLDNIILEDENLLDIGISGEGMVIGQTYKRNIYISFGTSGNPYIMVGEEAKHYRATYTIHCTENGTMPPPPQKWGTIKMTLVGAPLSIMQSVTSPAFSFPYPEGDKGNIVRYVSFPFSEDVIPTESDKNTFKRGTIRFKRKVGSLWVDEGLPVQYTDLYSPANGVSFARISGGKPVEFTVPRPIYPDVYEYQAVWSLY